MRHITIFIQINTFGEQNFNKKLTILKKGMVTCLRMNSNGTPTKKQKFQNLLQRHIPVPKPRSLPLKIIWILFRDQANEEKNMD